jgi:hypothetical protein
VAAQGLFFLGWVRNWLRKYLQIEHIFLVDGTLFFQGHAFPGWR